MKRSVYIDTVDYTKISQEEEEANYFAACLLLPEDHLRLMLRLGYPKWGIAQAFAVPMALVDLRLRHLD